MDGCFVSWFVCLLVDVSGCQFVAGSLLGIFIKILNQCLTSDIAHVCLIKRVKGVQCLESDKCI